MSQTVHNKYNSDNRMIKAINYMRGIMIFIVIILHAFFHRVYEGDRSIVSDALQGPIWVIAILAPIGIVSLWGTGFSFLSAMSAAYSSVKKINNPNNSLQRVIKQRVFSGLGLYAAWGFERFIISWIRRSFANWEISPLKLTDLLYSSTIEAMALANLTLAGIFYLIWKKGYSPKRTIQVLVGIGFFILVSSLITDQILTDVPAFATDLKATNDFAFILMERLYFQEFSILPVMGFSMMGAAIGVMLGKNEQFKKIRNFGLILSAILISTGGAVILSGYNLELGFYNTISPQPLEWVNLGLQILVIIGLLRVFDYRKKPMKRTPKSFPFFEAFSNMSLTIYLWEGLINTVIYKGYIVFIGEQGFRGDWSMIYMFIQTNLIFWILVVTISKKMRYIFSAEWTLLKLKNLGRKKTQTQRKTEKYQPILVKPPVLIPIKASKSMNTDLIKIPRLNSILLYPRFQNPTHPKNLTNLSLQHE